MESSPSSTRACESRRSFFEKLCQPCEIMLLENPAPVTDPKNPVKPAHHANLGSLRSAAVNGCFVCHSLWASLARDYDLKYRRLRDLDAVTYRLFRGRVRAVEDVGSMKLALRLDVMDRRGRQMMIDSGPLGIGAFSEFQLDPISQNIDKAVWPPVDEARTTMDRVSLDKAAQWLKNCDILHKQCSSRMRATDSSWQPTRLLFVEDTPSLPRVRLTLPEDRGGSVRYVTLSHQWGAAKFLKLTSDKVDAMRLLGIPFEDLSQTFQDAILVCLTLGFQYIWIDSLCIIQDSQSDWLREASMMRMAYQGSALTISATGRHSMSEGLGSLRHLNCTIQDVDLSRDTHDVQRCLLYDRKFWETYILRAPLMKRGWVLQERLLSPRILHFAQGQLAWECDALETCELYEMGPASHFARDVGYSMRASRFDMKPVVQAQHDRSMFRQRWWRVVETYSECQLTEKSDKLIALGGIAASFSRETDCQYVAGLWTSHLVQDLAWRRIRTLEGRRMQDLEYRAPSWSWASVDCPIDFSNFCRPEVGRQDLAELVDVTVDLVDPNNPFGAVKDGRLILRGILATARYCDNWETTERDGFLHLDVSAWEEYGFKPEMIAFHPDDLTDIPPDIYVFALALFSSDGLRFCGLALAKESNARTADIICYRRVGTCAVYVDVDLEANKMQQAPRDLIMVI